MFQVEYTMKPRGSIVYNVEAPTKEEARRIADGWYAIECKGYAVKKVTVK